MGSSPSDRSGAEDADVVRAIAERLDEMIELPAMVADETSPRVTCIRCEISEYNAIVETMKRDVDHVTKVVNGGTSSTPHWQTTLASFSCNKVPVTWSTLIGGSEHVDLSLSDWLTDLECRLEAIAQYAYRLTQGDEVAVYHVAALLRPQRFIQSVLQQHARSKFRDLHSFTLDVQVR